MEPAHNSETTMSERPYLTFRNASRRARGRGMARVAAAREELCKKRRATRVFDDGGRPTPRGYGTAHEVRLLRCPQPVSSVTPENTSAATSVSEGDPFYARLSLSNIALRCLLG